MGQDTWNLRHKFNSQGPALRILGLRVAISNFQGPGCQGLMSQSPSSRVLGVRVPYSRVPDSQGNGSQSLKVLGPGVPGLSVSSPGSQVLILDCVPFE